MLRCYYVITEAKSNKYITTLIKSDFKNPFLTKFLRDCGLKSIRYKLYKYYISKAYNEE